MLENFHIFMTNNIYPVNGRIEDKDKKVIQPLQNKV